MQYCAIIPGHDCQSLHAPQMGRSAERNNSLRGHRLRSWFPSRRIFQSRDPSEDLAVAEKSFHTEVAMKSLPELISSWRKQAKKYVAVTEPSLEADPFPRTLLIDAIVILDGVSDSAYLAARGTEKLNNPSFTRSQMYWKGRADAAEDVRKLLGKEK